MCKGQPQHGQGTAPACARDSPSMEWCCQAPPPTSCPGLCTHSEAGSACSPACAPPAPPATGRWSTPSDRLAWRCRWPGAAHLGCHAHSVVPHAHQAPVALVRQQQADADAPGALAIRLQCQHAAPSVGLSRQVVRRHAASQRAPAPHTPWWPAAHCRSAPPARRQMGGAPGPQNTRSRLPWSASWGAG